MNPDEVDELVREGFPVAYHGGYRCLRLGEGWAEATRIYDPTTLLPGGYISGPVLFGLADVTLWFATFTVLGLAPMAVTSDLSITFLRPAIGGDVLARAELLKGGRTRLYGAVKLWMESDTTRLIAHVTGSYSPPANPWFQGSWRRRSGSM